MYSTPRQQHESDELVAKLHAEIADDLVHQAVVDWDGGRITRMEFIGRIGKADSVAFRAVQRGWDFLYQTKTAA